METGVRFDVVRNVSERAVGTDPMLFGGLQKKRLSHDFPSTYTLRKLTFRADLEGMWKFYRGWKSGDPLLALLRQCFAYKPDEVRASNYIYSEEKDWPASFIDVGPLLLDELELLVGVRFDCALYQAYRDGTAGCEWHHDAADAQAILSLGATRRFGLRRVAGESEYFVVQNGDLFFQPSGSQNDWEHCIPEDRGVTEERCSLVFRTGSPWG